MVRIKPVGDSAVAVVFGETIDEGVNSEVLAVASVIEKNLNVEVVPTYTSVYIYYDPLEYSYSRLIYEINKSLSKKHLSVEGKIVEVPVLYGGEFGPDLNFVASHNSLSPDMVIKIHSRPVYRVYMLGFMPGFAYLGGMDPRIAAPRLGTPRLKVPPGSIGIADRQTGWYAVESPGGWRIIGRTPIRIFDTGWDVPSIVVPGDHVKFKPITEREFFQIYEEEWGNEKH